MQQRQFRVADIAAQAQLSRASVDRVLHHRPGVRSETVAQVEAAIAELERQQAMVRLSGVTVWVDLVMQATNRFTEVFRPTFERELRSFRPVTLRLRSHLQERSDPHAAAAVLHEIARRGSDGVVLRAPDHPAVAAGIQTLTDAYIPTVTFTSDVANSSRVAYVGVDNRAAGATAAYLIAQWARPCRAVLIPYSSSIFLGEGERADGFRRTLHQLDPGCVVHEVRQTDGLHDSMLAATRDALRRWPDVEAVYSVGGANAAILQAFAELDRPLRAFIAHDLDTDNLRLLRSGRISAVLHHDLLADVHSVCSLLLQAHGTLGRRGHDASPVQVVTPYNEPRFPLSAGQQPSSWASVVSGAAG